MTDEMRFTPLQQTALKRLLHLKATGEKAGVDTAGDADLNVMAIGRLRRLGLVESRVVKRAPDEPGHYGQRTKYWLTAEGVKTAKVFAKKSAK